MRVKTQTYKDGLIIEEQIHETKHIAQLYKRDYLTSYNIHKRVKHNIQVIITKLNK